VFQQRISEIAQEANRISQNLQSVGNESSSIRNTLVDNLGSFCPQNADALQQQTGVNFDQQAQQAIDLLNQLGDFVNNQLQDVQTGINLVQKGTNDVEKTVNEIDVNDWQVLVILIPWILVPSFLLVGVVMAWWEVSTNVYDCLLQWFFLPLLVIMTIASISLSSAISIMAVSNAGKLLGRCFAILRLSSTHLKLIETFLRLLLWAPK
jgi:hypothetical protein